ncbi:unnamed protein product, partial [Amoebophrya sp. A25]|eukprot:GSA25T00027632001.1
MRSGDNFSEQSRALYLRQAMSAAASEATQPSSFALSSAVESGGGYRSERDRMNATGGAAAGTHQNRINSSSSGVNLQQDSSGRGGIRLPFYGVAPPPPPVSSARHAPPSLSRFGADRQGSAQRDGEDPRGGDLVGKYQHQDALDQFFRLDQHDGAAGDSIMQQEQVDGGMQIVHSKELR